MKELLENFNLEKGFELILEYGIPLVKAILIYLIGRWLINKVLRVTQKFMLLRKYDVTLEKFLLNLIKWGGLWILLIVSIVGTLGIQRPALQQL
ncbi:small-conductance mechanosensitive channel [Nonlabens ulvanivorans]|uniref:Small-conductance mechanosensitive channel n=1 Tax=Nonlabens ulvanivorans TaxID=906888 RepID=A0A090QA69_NONUL|nr:small-conductance mechanosensitive channel [Nonlabens ulvanivorans]